MKKMDALLEFKSMWTWLYRHPAHGKEYYVKYVAKVAEGWINDCPLCDFSDGDCRECLELWNNGNGHLCADPESPLAMWKQTHLEESHFRTWYAGKIIDITSKAIEKDQKSIDTR